MQPDRLAAEVAAAIRGAVAPLAGRVVALEAAGGELAPMRAAVAGLESQMMDADHAIFGRDGLAARLGALETRQATLETRDPIPGPSGPPGPAGRDGLDGKDGAPGLRYLGVHVAGKTYDVGDLVTASGSAWYCGRTTTGTPGHSPDWQLMVKRGRDARGRD